jgi:CubicO group peptidase (beta-lactamase class C family)
MVRSEALDALVTRAHREIDEGILPSCQLAIAQHGAVVHTETIGDAPHGEDTRYVMFSSTKAIVASAIWQLLAEGAIRLEDRVAEHIPEFGSNGKEAVTIEQVLLHTSGFPRAPLGPPRWLTREGRLEAFARWRLNWDPGSRFEYHATSAHWVLAELLARADGVEHTESIRRRVIDPLGLQKLRVGVPVDEQGDIAPLVHTGEPPTPDEFEAAIGAPGIDLGEVTEHALEGFNHPDALALGVPGGGGVSTAADLALFYQALLHNPGNLWDPKWLTIGTSDVRNTFDDYLAGGIPTRRTIGVVLAGDDGLGPRRGFGHGNSPATFGHDGAGGQLAWADPETGISFAYLTNGLDRHLIRQWRRNIGLNSTAANLGTNRSASGLPLL